MRSQLRAVHGRGNSFQWFVFVGVLAACVWSMAPGVYAVVLISDGFGDGDVDNNGTPLEIADVDVSGRGNGAVGPYVPLEVAGVPGGTPPVFPAATMVNEATSIDNAADVGIKWFSIGPWNGTDPDPTASAHIINDATGALPETNSSIGFYHAAAGTTQVAEAINSGSALAVELVGRGDPAAGFFGQQVKLGPAVNDEVKFSFDFRIWYSAPNFNGNALNHIPRLGDFRFGVFQDTDHQLGKVNTTAGPNGTPATWGQGNGQFRGDNGTVGAQGDHGWFVRVPIDDPNDSTFDQLSSAVARINEENNDSLDSDPRIMNGSTDFVANPTSNPGATPFPTKGIGIDKVYNLALGLKRFDDPDTAGDAGDTIFATMTITERSTGTTWSFGNYEKVGVAASGDPDGGVESDSWDYFAMTTGGSSSSDDFDWLIDNFKVELFGSNAVVNNADFNSDGKVDGRDYLVWQRGLGLTGQPNRSTGDANGDGAVNADDLAVWKMQFGTSPAAAAVASAPEPTGSLIALAAAGLLPWARKRYSH